MNLELWAGPRASLGFDSHYEHTLSVARGFVILRWHRRNLIKILKMAVREVLVRHVGLHIKQFLVLEQESVGRCSRASYSWLPKSKELVQE